MKGMQLIEGSCQFALVWAAAFQSILRCGVGQMEQKPFQLPQKVCCELVASREVTSRSLCLWIREKDPQAFFFPKCASVDVFLNNLLCQASISCSSKI